MESKEKIDKKPKAKHDMGRIITKIVAAILAILMVLAVATTLIYYLIPA